MHKCEIEIGKLFDDLVNEGRRIIHCKDYDLIYCGDIKIMTYDMKYVTINYISRHKTNKDLINITVNESNCVKHVTVTTDHVCMIFNREHFFENVNAKNLHIGDLVSVYDNEFDNEFVGTIVGLDNIGTTFEYVYDCEVEDDMHCFYANDILIHNSQFTNMKAITDDWISKYNLPNRLSDWSDEWKLKLWDFFEDFVNNEMTPFVRNLVHEWCHSDETEMLSYALEYVGDVGIYQAKKKYACHHIIEEGRELVDKIVYKGIELKKGNLDKAVKDILAPIYKNTLTTDYKEEDFKKYIREAYEKFLTMDVDDIAFWKGYNTERKASGFLQMEKIVADDGHTVGTTSVSAAGTYYNQLLENLGIGDKYESIILGDKIRFVYVKCQKYPIKYIAYKSRFPKEFYDIMQIDYGTMFKKTVLKPLERYFIASGFTQFDPTKMYAESIDDL